MSARHDGWETGSDLGPDSPFSRRRFLIAGAAGAAALTSAQALVDRPGNDALHLVFADQRNGQITLSAPPAVTFRRDGSTASRSLTMRQVGTNALTRGDFFGTAAFTGGRWDFHVTATEPDGTRLAADFALTVS